VRARLSGADSTTKVKAGQYVGITDDGMLSQWTMYSGAYVIEGNATAGGTGKVLLLGAPC
jgi:hypothetical protein